MSDHSFEESQVLPPAIVNVAGVQLSVRPPRPNHPLYEYWMEPGNGKPGITAKLSYDLLKRDAPRSLLRVDSGVASQILPLRQQPSFQVLSALVQARYAHELGNFRIQKGIVVDIDRNGPPHKDVTITVHRHGAVPVAIIPIGLKPDAVSAWNDVRLGVYASLSQANHELSPLASKADLLRSCKVQLDLLLRSYLEEAAAEFFDIEHHASRRETFQRLKQVEEVFAASVKPKLEVILNTEKTSHLHKLAHEVWRTFSVSIVSAALGRVFALRLVNELYRCLGVWDRVQDYEDQWLQVSGRLRSLYEGAFDYSFPTGSDPDLLRRSREAFSADDSDELDRLIDEAGNRVWLRRFMEFARFVSAIRAEKAIVGTPRLFISAQHQVGSATAFAQSVRSFLQGNLCRNGRPLAEISRVGPDTPANGHIERLIKFRIWQSDAVLGTIPKDWSYSQSGGAKDLQWIAREADHALLLSRKLHLFVQQGADRNQVQAEFEKEFAHLSPAEGRLPEVERRRMLPTAFAQFVSDQYQYDGNAPEIKHLEEIVDRARARHARELIRGFLQQFPRTDRYTILKVLEVAHGSTKRAELVRRLAVDGVRDGFYTGAEDAGAALDRARTNSRNRFLRIESQKLSLITLVDHSYRGNLRVILESLRPELKVAQITEWHDRFIRELLDGL